MDQDETKTGVVGVQRHHACHAVGVVVGVRDDHRHAEPFAHRCIVLTRATRWRSPHPTPGTSDATVMLAHAASLRPRADGDPVIFATKVALHSLGRRVQTLDAERARLDELLGELVTATAPSLVALPGVGVDTAAALLVSAGDNPQRLRSEAAWAHLCGVAPIQASSGKITRWRLKRGGDRNANAALWRIVMTRMRYDPRTRVYVQRRLDEGRTKPEIMRVLKRYIAREVYRHLPRP
jgi:transposase